MFRVLFVPVAIYRLPETKKTGKIPFFTPSEKYMNIGI
jgi:hypothetical protein